MPETERQTMTEPEYQMCFAWMERNATWAKEVSLIKKLREERDYWEAQAKRTSVENVREERLRAYYRGEG